MKVFIFVIAIIANSFIGIAQEIIEPVFDRSDVPEFHVEKVVITQDTTFIYCFYKAEAGSWARISKDMYLEDVNNGDRLPLLKASGLPYAPLRREFLFNETIHVLLHFPYINSDKFNLIEEKGEKAFNIYGINISECYTTKYDVSDYGRFRNMSDFYKSANNDEKFLEFKEKELNAAQYFFGLRSLPVSGCYFQLSELYNRIGNYTEAITHGMLSLECDSITFGIEKINHPVYPMKFHILSAYYQNAGNDSAAIQCLKKTIDIWRDVKNEEEYLEAVYYLLLSGYGTNGIKKRIEIVKNEFDNFPSYVNDTTILIAKIQSQMGFSYYQLSDFPQAVKWCDNALATLRKADRTSKKEFAEVLSFKCLCQSKNGKLDDAINIGEVAKSQFDSLNVKSAKYVELLDVLAGLYHEKFDYEKAIVLEENAIPIYEDAKAWLSLAASYTLLGRYYEGKYDYGNAETYIKKAIEILDTHDDANQGVVDTFNSIGVIESYEELGEDLTTENPFMASPIRISNIINDHNIVMIANKDELARIYQENNKLSDAINTEKEVLNLSKSIENKQGYANHLLCLSRYYLYDKQYKNAIDCAEESLHIFEKIDRNKVFAALSCLGDIYFLIEDYEKSIQYDRKALLLLNDDNSRFIKNAILSGLSYSYYYNRDLEESEKCLSELLDDFTNVICKKMENFTNAQRQRIWNEYEHNFILYRNVISEFNHNERFLPKLYSYMLFSKRLMLDANIIQDGNCYSLQRATWKDIQHNLSKDDLAIEFFTTFREGSEDYIYNALIIDKNSQCPMLITLNSEEDFSDVESNLGEVIWKPILSKFKNIKNIYFAPDGYLNIFPIEYLKIDDERYVFDKYNIYRLSSTKELLKKQNENKQGQAVLYGGLEYNQTTDFAYSDAKRSMSSMLRSISERGGFDPLYNTMNEVCEIDSLLSNQHIATTLYVGNDGTEESFRKLSNTDVNMLHLATHGMYIEPENVSSERLRRNFDFLESLNNEKNPVKEDVTLTHSFLVLSGGNKLIQHNKVLGDDDGILTAKEISETDLKGVDLVVLSACESALGDINSNGVYGLQRGFKKAGVNTILMSLGKVDDEATRILMVEFYRNLMSGKSKYQSLKDAQQYLREYENGKYDDPKYWASFIMLDGIN